MRAYSKGLVMNEGLTKLEQFSRRLLFVLLLIFIVLIAGCASPEPIIKTEFRDRLVPVKCDVIMPAKPSYDASNPSSAAKLELYYKEVEGLLRGCIKDE